MKKFLFNGVKAVVVKNVGSITKRTSSVLDVDKRYYYFIDILYKTGIAESISYKDNIKNRNVDFLNFLKC